MREEAAVAAAAAAANGNSSELLPATARNREAAPKASQRQPDLQVLVPFAPLDLMQAQWRRRVIAKVLENFFRIPGFGS
ncbi:hypothetical protein ACP70R_043808 [Stipagrostis hirtigluma subsp. patula]